MGGGARRRVAAAQTDPRCGAVIRRALEHDPGLEHGIAGLLAIHTNAGNSGRTRDEALFPLVGDHPETGRRSLLYSAHHVQGFAELMPEESAMLLDRLQSLTQRPSFATRQHWHPGTIALWDNRCVQHYVVPDFVGSRLLYQVSVSAELPRPLPHYRPPSDEQRPVPRSDVAPRPATDAAKGELRAAPSSARR